MDPQGRQIHDYNPGYLGGWPSGVFWTLPIAPGSVSVDPSTGDAVYRVHNLDLPDYGDFANAFANGRTSPGRVSFEVRFDGTGSGHYQYEHSADPVEPDTYALEYWQTTATLEWSCETEGGFAFESYAIDDYPEERSPGQLFAITGLERNGVYA